MGPYGLSTRLLKHYRQTFVVLQIEIKSSDDHLIKLF